MVRFLPRVSVIVIAVAALYSLALTPVASPQVAMAPMAQAGALDTDGLGENISDLLTNPLNERDMAVPKGLGGSVSIAE